MPRKLVVLVLALIIMTLGVSAQQADNTLTNNTGNASTLWFISGEPSLVINGFDLESRSISTPIQVESISISVRKAVPGAHVEAVVYQDQDGGSPQNATLLARKTVDITSAGVWTVKFDAPVQVTQRFLWVGFYLPVDFEFRADTQGKSVLTYWGWVPNGGVDVVNLSSASVFGPSDGSAPVGIAMNGVARINAHIISGGQVITPPVGSVQQIVGDANTNLSTLTRYNVCDIMYDAADLYVTYKSAINVDCKVVTDKYDAPAPDGYEKRGLTYDIYSFGTTSGGLAPYPFPITHCIVPTQANIDAGAVIGLSWGAPRKWQLLPTVRFGSHLCAEVSYSGSFSIFVPR